MNTWPWYRLCTTVASTKCGIAVLDEGDLRTAWPIRSVIFPGRSDIYPFRPVGYNFISQQNITSVFLNDRSSLAGLHLTTHLQEDDELDAAIAVSMVENNPPYLTGKMPGKKHSLALWVFRYTFYFERAWRDILSWRTYLGYKWSLLRPTQAPVMTKTSLRAMGLGQHANYLHFFASHIGIIIYFVYILLHTVP